MILIIDNYDSFSYNLVQMLGEILQENQLEHIPIQVIRNDELTVEEIEKMAPSHIILSPGPGRPVDAGVCEELVLNLGRNTSILGVCLGHQAICEAFGANITYAKKLMHGKQSVIQLEQSCPLFENLDKQEKVGRYHSLVADQRTIPEELQVMAVDSMGEVMAVKHREYEIYGVQFHPESILTIHGKQILQNFLLSRCM